MTQLVELQKHADTLTKLGAEVIVVAREDKLGTDGLKKTKARTKTTFVLVDDFKEKSTAKYVGHGDAFATYVIDKQGIIRAELVGTKTKRPKSALVLAELKKLAGKKK